ncbi:ABC transporter ATP-binding protein [Halioglobus maricola]|uniref:ABC transporter ATP-binding protein n=1 Tax=Halioglobus maricola TaxID=2601894 RepID=A0A5P9NK82_9GAMM|nr:ABC transporter ATP-binding protein [Halioglobus maricola]QFU76273.1 ABC transporter ATP-binding protein [Halioglobus maricola]
MSGQLELREVSVNYGEFVAARNVSLSLRAGQIGCLLGPSGCGKTTLLRAIAGFEAIASGEINLQGRRISSSGHSVPPEQRKVGMVFQDFALFPHLDVERNVGFGLAGLDASRRSQRVQEMLQLVGLAGYGGRYPHELSGGQQQRVALARALAPEPELLLLDEPFSSLDSQLREQLACEVRDLLKATGVTAVLVTHDQHEAFAMAEHIALLDEGRVVQAGTPWELYNRPVDEFVAGFMGQGSVITFAEGGSERLARQLGLGGVSTGAQHRVLIRPEAVTYSADSDLRLTITARTFRGSEYLYELALEGDQRLLCLAPNEVDLTVGSLLPVRIDSTRVVKLPH